MKGTPLFFSNRSRVYHSIGIFATQPFVAALGASDLLFTEVYPDMSIASWIDAHIKAFEYFGGIPEIVVPDNCKTAVKKPCYYEPELNATYTEMASHYGCAVIPARVRKPKDKPLAEGGVQIVERWIIAKLRHQQFFSLYELRGVVRQLLDEANSKPFQKREGSRRSIWETIEKPLLRPLPAVAYEFADLKRAKVNVDYHVEVEGNYYSVPYQLIKQEVLVRMTSRTIEVLAKGVRIASHARQVANKHAFSTVPEHMPPNHRQVGEWTPERIVKWAHSIGINTSLLVKTILNAKTHPQQAYRSCMGIIRLAKAYGQERVERACLRALNYGAHSYASVRSILEKNLDMEPPKEEQQQVSLQHENIRGIKYYSGEVQ